MSKSLYEQWVENARKRNAQRVVDKLNKKPEKREMFYQNNIVRPMDDHELERT